MPGSVIYATLATGSVGFQRSGSMAPGMEQHSDLERADQDYQRRRPRSIDDRACWLTWPTSRFGGAGQMDACLAQQESGSYAAYEPPRQPYGGQQHRKAIIGVVYGADGVTPEANVTVQAFVTATDLYVGDGVSNLDGTYKVLMEQQKTTAHYLVAYKAGSPDVGGTTVNTLLPTEPDGSA